MFTIIDTGSNHNTVVDVVVVVVVVVDDLVPTFLGLLDLLVYTKYY